MTTHILGARLRRALAFSLTAGALGSLLACAVAAAPPVVAGGLTTLAAAGHPLDVFLLYPNYRGMLFYRDATPDIRLRVRLTSGSTSGVSRMYATLRDEARGVVTLQRELSIATDFVATLDGTSLAAVMPDEAPSLLTVSVVKDGVTSTYPAYRVGRVHESRRSEMTIAYDEKNRILVRGVPRFLLGVYDSGLNITDTLTDPAWWQQYVWAPNGHRRMNGLATNFYLNYWFGGTAAPPIKALMQTLGTRRADGIPLKNPAGMLYLQTGNCSHANPAIGGTWQFEINDPNYVRDVGAEPGLGGYYVMDKCVESLKPGVMAQYAGDPTASITSTAHDGLRRLDPDSMTLGVQGEQDIQTTFGIPLIAGWRDTADLLGTNPYPNAGAESDGPGGLYYHAKVADWTARTADEVQRARPYVTVLQAFKYTTEGRWPSRLDKRNHAYMAIIEGAAGLWWWSLGTVSSSTGSLALVTICGSDVWCAERTARMNDIRAVVLEVADLEPALLSDDAGPVAVTNATDGAPLPAIRTRVKRLPDGTTYIFAANYTAQTLTARLAWSTSNPVVVHAEETTCGGVPCARRITPSAGSFADVFGPYQAHVYVIDSTAPTATITAPTEGATVGGTVHVTAAVSAGSGYTFNFAVDGTVVQDGPSSELLWDTRALPPGSHLLTLTVKAGGQIVTRATRTVAVTTVANTAPSAQPATLTLDQDTAAVVTLTATDPDQCELTFSIATPPQRGTLGAVASQTCVPGTPHVDRATVTYTPNAGWSGSDSFTFRANDGITSGTATVAITVNGTAPPRPMYVSAVAFESRQRGRHHDERVAVTVREALGGTAQPTDPLVASASVTLEIRNASGALIARLTGLTNTQGIFRTGWVQNLANGAYTARVTELTRSSLAWNSALDVQAGSHAIPH